MDTCGQRLREIPQRSRGWLSIRRIFPWFHPRWELHRPDREGIHVQRELQDFPQAVLGGSDEHIRARPRLDPVDVEDRNRRRVVIPSWFGQRMDTPEPHYPPIPQHLRMIALPS